jgi:hypothetical protein
MKASNVLLGVISIALVFAALFGVYLMTDTTPSSAIFIPGIKGKAGGYSVEVPQNLTEKQMRLLTMAYDIAKRDGHKYPQILQGILLQETKAGEMKSYTVAGHEFGLGVNQRYYGPCQIKLAAAKDVLQEYSSMFKEFSFHTNTDEEIIANLMLNEKFAISVASKYLLILQKRYNIPEHQLAAAYNQGAGGFTNSNGQRYAAAVRQFAEKMKK